jgi:hypothetical protein
VLSKRENHRYGFLSVDVKLQGFIVAGCKIKRKIAGLPSRSKGVLCNANPDSGVYWMKVINYVEVENTLS